MKKFRKHEKSIMHSLAIKSIMLHKASALNAVLSEAVKKDHAVAIMEWELMF